MFHHLLFISKRNVHINIPCKFLVVLDAIDLNRKYKIKYRK